LVIVKRYNHLSIEKKWQARWKKVKLFKTSERKGKPKSYVLDMFPYPSGEGLHVGHPKGYIATDIYSRYKKMTGHNVLHPMGFDAFGLPAENYALKNKVHPAVAVAKNIKRYKEQLSVIGFNYDWDRVLDTTDPSYYKWTQWIFLKLFKKGLAYQSFEPINWCPSCKTGLANEDVESGACERCGTPVERKPLRQWVLKITAYADRLLRDLDAVDLDSIPRVVDSKNPPKNGLPMVARRTIHALVRDPRTKKFLCLNWKKHPWTTFVVGGVEGTENVVEAALREIKEETGYTSVTFIRELGGPVQSEYFAAHKNENRLALTTGLLFELTADTQVAVSEQERAKHDIEWLSEDELTAERMTCAELPLWLERIKNKDAGKIKPLLDWPESIKQSQRNWIGRSEGVDLTLKVKDLDVEVTMYDSIPQTFAAQTFTVIAPEHPLVEALVKGTEYEKKVLDFVASIKEKKARKEFDHFKDMEGVFTGRYVEYPPTGRLLPIWVASYALVDYGSGIVNCSAHDERDFVFAKKYGIELHPVLFPADKKLAEKVAKTEVFYREPNGILKEPSMFEGRRWDEARKDIIDYLVKQGWAKRSVNYKLRDWVFSRQRYWGEPIPVVHCEQCKTRKALLIHGFEGHGGNHWFNWIKKQLESKGIRVFTPTMSTSAHPTVATWREELEPLVKDFGPNDLIIGHSLGSNAALQVVQAEKKNRGHVFLVASAIGHPRSQEHWKKLRREWKGSDIDALEKFWQTKIDFKKVIKNTSSVTIIRSKDDDVIPKDTHENLPPSFIQHEWDGYGHFDTKEPIPELLDIIRAKISDGVVAVPEKDLPVKLPKVSSYEPTGTGDSPLAGIESWVNTKCPECKGPARRETNTMPQWAGSSWYYLRFIDPQNKKNFVDPKKEKYWSPVDFYVGGAEHATRHLIYARFWHKFLYDEGYVTREEPFSRLQHVGLIAGTDGRKMSKRFGNVINPDDIVKTYGADTLRVYEMFMGPFDQGSAWSTESIAGSRRFIERIWRLREKVILKHVSGTTLSPVINKTVRKVTEDIEAFKFNTAVSALMILVNEMEKVSNLSKVEFETLLLLVAPFAPHITDELWETLGHKKSIYLESWPSFTTTESFTETISIVVQINGKVRAQLNIPNGSTDKEVEALVLSDEVVQKWVAGGSVKKFIYVPRRLANVVVSHP
jgi:leucyl-tRNA synthetase/predicted alpha/beta hydrolase family esterase